MCGVISRVAMTCVVAFFIFCAVGCEGDRGPAGPAGEALPFIVAAIETAGAGGSSDSTGDATVYIFGVDHIPRVEINNIGIPYAGNTYRPSEHNELPFFFLEDLPITAGEHALLSVTYSDFGAAESDITLPAAFSLIAPDSTPAFGDTVTFEWSASGGANAYFIELSVNIFYWNHQGDYEDFLFTHDTITAETQITFAPGEFFPDPGSIEEIDMGGCNLYLWSIVGPILPMDPGNVQGNGTGFFTGWTYGGVYSFHWEGVSDTGQQSSRGRNQNEPGSFERGRGAPGGRWSLAFLCPYQ